MLQQFSLCLKYAAASEAAEHLFVQMSMHVGAQVAWMSEGTWTERTLVGLLARVSPQVHSHVVGALCSIVTQVAQAHFVHNGEHRWGTGFARPWKNGTQGVSSTEGCPQSQVERYTPEVECLQMRTQLVFASFFDQCTRKAGYITHGIN